MSLNKNLKTRRKQLAILAAVIVGGAAATSGVIWYGQHQQEQKHPAPVTDGKNHPGHPALSRTGAGAAGV